MSMLQNIKEKKKKVNLLRGTELLDYEIEVLDGMYEKCPACDAIIEATTLQKNAKVCIHCDYHMRLHIAQRARLIFDKLEVFHHIMISKAPLNFPGYKAKLGHLTESLGVYDGVVCAEAMLKHQSVIAVIMDPDFLMGSMGSVVGEKITRAFERAQKQRKPLILFSASGGARMQEGMISLMQMAKTSGAVKRFKDAGGLYIVVMTDPTTGGVSASFASLGDIILAEPRALIGFAGKRVIEQTIQQDLPEGFQSSEFLLERGYIDKIVHRHDLKETLSKILTMHGVTS